MQGEQGAGKLKRHRDVSFGAAHAATTLWKRWGELAGMSWTTSKPLHLRNVGNGPQAHGTPFCVAFSRFARPG